MYKEGLKWRWTTCGSRPLHNTWVTWGGYDGVLLKKPFTLVEGACMQEVKPILREGRRIYDSCLEHVMASWCLNSIVTKNSHYLLTINFPLVKPLCLDLYFCLISPYGRGHVWLIFLKTTVDPHGFYREMSGISTNFFNRQIAGDETNKVKNEKEAEYWTIKIRIFWFSIPWNMYLKINR